MDKQHFKEHDGTINQVRNLEGRVCLRPFQLMEIQKEFYSYLCCPSWLPTIVGNSENSSLMEAWNSQRSQEIRASIHDGSFKFCDKLECPHIQSNTLPSREEIPESMQDIFRQRKVVLDSPPEEIALCYDDSCNLACPSCRATRSSLKSGSEFERRLKFTERLLEDLKTESRKRRVILRVTGSGDPIGSKVFRMSLMAMRSEDFPHLEIVLQTNGVLLSERVWHDLRGIREKIKHVSVSIDAGTPETYARVRRFGSWPKLWQNLIYLSKLRAEGELSSLSLNYVVQADNYSEMPEFIRLGQGLAKVDKIFFTFINDWGVLEHDQYTRKCIWKSHHPEFKKFLSVLKSPVFDSPEVDMGNIYSYRVLALRSDSDPISENFRTFDR